MGRKGKKHKGRRATSRPSSQKHQDAPGLLREALRRLRRNNTGHAIRHARQASEAAASPEQKKAAEQVLSEAHFQAALGSPTLDRRLEHLVVALRHTPDGARFHVYQGITLWQQGRTAKAVEALKSAAAYPPQPPGLSYLRQLVQLASGAPVAADLSAAERDVLQLVAALIEGKPSRDLYALLQKSWPGQDKTAWKAFIQMSASETAAPTDLLKQALEHTTRQPIENVLRYYQGVAALRKGNREVALVSWQEAGGLGQPWLEQNLISALREQVFEYAQTHQWAALTDLDRHLPATVEDRILTETVSLAYFHLGYDAARAGQWKTAVQHWRKANERTPTHQLAQNLALAEEAMGNWVEAAEAWRSMVRRRPRKATHPDYLSDAQVAALWKHAADCYEKVDATEEVLTCLKHAGKYAPDDIEIRLNKVDLLMAEERPEAAKNELDRVLEDNPDHIETLLRLATLYDNQWNRDAMPLWQRVLVLNPHHREAREALAENYLKKTASPTARFGLFFNPEKRVKNYIKLLRQGLEELPDHPKLLLRLGLLYQHAGKDEQARTTLLRAYHAAPTDPSIVGAVLHELLHLDGDDTVEELLPAVRQIEDLLPSFWIDQGRRVLQCELDEVWTMQFFEEAEKLSARPYVEETRASLLVEMFEVASNADAYDLADQYEQRIHDEVPDSGAPEYLTAHHLLHDEGDFRQVLQWLRKAKRAARRARDTAMFNLAEDREQFLKLGPATLLDLLSEMYYDE